MLQELGIPTANVDSESLRACLAEAVTGIYAGWASVGSSPACYKMVMSIGWNPHYGNSEKTAEPWLLHEFDKVRWAGLVRQCVRGGAAVCEGEQPPAALRSNGHLSRSAHTRSAGLTHQRAWLRRRTACLHSHAAKHSHVPAALLPPAHPLVCLVHQPHLWHQWHRST
jgi:hypothetical protein